MTSDPMIIGLPWKPSSGFTLDAEFGIQDSDPISPEGRGWIIAEFATKEQRDFAIEAANAYSKLTTEPAEPTPPNREWRDYE